MAFPYVLPVNGTADSARSILASFPVDWYDQVRTNGPLPVILFIHGGDQNAFDFMFTTFKITSWWKTTFAFPAKAIAIDSQGVSLDSNGGDWNAGNMGTVNRLPGAQDSAFAWDAMNRVERWLIDWFRKEIRPVVGGADISQVFNRQKLLPVGFSQGGQFAYRLASEAPKEGWKCPALAVFGTSIGGWYREVDRVAALPPNVDWTPTGEPPALFHVHGTIDTKVNVTANGKSTDTNTVITDQVGAALVDTYARADISGFNSTAAYVARATALGWPFVAGAVPPSSIPAAVVAVTTFTVANWNKPGGGSPDYQVCFANVGGGMIHEVPYWAPEAVAEFFKLWGGL